MKRGKRGVLPGAIAVVAVVAVVGIVLWLSLGGTRSGQAASRMPAAESASVGGPFEGLAGQGLIGQIADNPKAPAVSQAEAVKSAVAELGGQTPSVFETYNALVGARGVWLVLAGGGSICPPDLSGLGECNGNTLVVVIDSATGEVLGVRANGFSMSAKDAATSAPESLQDVMSGESRVTPGLGTPTPSGSPAGAG